MRKTFQPASIFMSDLAQNFYNAWYSVFSLPQKQLYCSWHVDRAWKKNTVKLIAKKEDQAEVYAYLKMVQMETDPGIFNRQLQEFLGFLQLRHKAFHDYFYPYYVCKDKVLLWATCHRIGSLANTNMYAEA